MTTTNNVLLRGLHPLIEAGDSTVGFLIGMKPASFGTPFDVVPPSSFQLRQALPPAPFDPSMTVRQRAFLHVANVPSGSNDGAWKGAAICATDLAGDNQALVEPSLSFRTFAGPDFERAKIDGQGLSCDRFTANAYANLVQDPYTADPFTPPSAAALSEAYLSLSNQIVGAVAGGLGTLSNGGTVTVAQLEDSYASTSISTAPTANALRAAYASLSNQFVTRLTTLESRIPGLVDIASRNVIAGVGTVVQGAVSNLTSNVPAVQRWGTGSGCCKSGPSSGSGGSLWAGTRWADAWNAAAGPVTWGDVARAAGIGKSVVVSAASSNATQLSMLAPPGVPPEAILFNFELGGGSSLINDVWVPSTGDNQGRFLFDTNGATHFGASAGLGGLAFAWYNNDIASNVMRLSEQGTLDVARDLGVGGDVAVTGDLLLGPEARLSYSGCNVGINMPSGTAPTCALHVSGAIYSEDVVFALSDASVKTDVRTIDHALDKVRAIRGCTYVRCDGPDRERQVGVIAQEVERVLPEAVHVGPDGKRSVAYGNLVALLVEAVKTLHDMHQDLCRRLETSLEKRS